MSKNWRGKNLPEFRTGFIQNHVDVLVLNYVESIHC